MPESVFNAINDFQPKTLLKRDSGKGIFLSILRNFYKHPFCRAPTVFICYLSSHCNMLEIEKNIKVL